MTYLLIYIAIGCLNASLNFWMIKHLKKSRDRQLAAIRELIEISPVHRAFFTAVFIATWPIFIPIWFSMLLSIRVSMTVHEGDDDDDKRE